MVILKPPITSIIRGRKFQTGNEIDELAHTNVQDTSIYSGLTETNLDGGANTVGLDSSQDEYRLLVNVDFGQIPFNPSMNVHSVSYGMYLQDLEYEWVQRE